MVTVKDKLRSVTFLTREQIDYLDKLGKDALFYRGVRLSRSQILSELVDLLISLGIDIKGTELRNSTLKEELLKIIGNHNHEKQN